MKKLDKDTQEQLRKEETAKRWVNSSEWAYVRSRIIDKIIDLQSIYNLDTSDPTTMAVDLRSRKAAADILIAWMRDIEGEASKFDDRFINDEYKQVIQRQFIVDLP